MLAVEGIPDDACVESEHLHVPILSAVFLIGLFESDAGIVVAAVAVSEHLFRVCDALDMIGQCIVEACCGSALEGEKSAPFGGGGFSADERYAPVLFGTHRHVRTVGRREDDSSLHGFDFPDLHFVRAVHLSRLHSPGISPQRHIPERADEPPGAREFAHIPVLSLSVRLGLAEMAPVGISQRCECHTAQMVEYAALIGRLGLHGDSGDCH